MSSINTTDLSGFSKQYAARDLPSNLKLKYREIGQAAPDEIRKDKKELRRDLDEREKIASSKDSSGRQRLSIADSEKSSSSSKKHKIIEPVNLDADEILPDDDDDEDNDSSDSDSDDDDGVDLKRRKKNKQEDEEEDDEDDDDDDDDTEALMAELNKIKQERAAEAAKQEAERKVREEKIRVENILKGNPLLNPDAGGSKGSAGNAGTSSDFKVKRRWDDDVVFKNCAKLDDNKKKDFINDTLRSEFHKKFMERYVK